MRQAWPLVLFLLAACDEQPVSRADLATLPGRARKGDKSAFEHLLKLRKSGEPDAVPVLIRVLEDHRGSTRIFRFAAEQALFHIGGMEAEAVLREDCAADDYPWWPAIDYTFHWDMDPGERDRFLARHVVRSSNTRLKARLTADRATAKPREDVAYTLSLANETSEPVAVLTADGYPTTALVFRDADGRFLRTGLLGTQCVRSKWAWQAIEPGKTVEFKLVRSLRLGEKRTPPTEHGRHLSVETKGGRGGRFDVVAVVSGLDRCREAGEPPATPWIGRVVSGPAALTISD